VLLSRAVECIPEVEPCCLCSCIIAFHGFFCRSGYHSLYMALALSVRVCTCMKI
jgi:hypothetical protein